MARGSEEEFDPFKGDLISSFFNLESETDNSIYFRHYMADLKYNRGIFILTFTTEDEDLQDQLHDELMDLGYNEGFIDSFGYSIEEFSGTPPFEWPEVETQ